MAQGTGENKLRSLAKIVALAAVLAGATPALAEIGRVKSNVGVASVNRGGRPVAVAPGVQLEPGDVLVTGRDGRMGVTFVDGTRFAVGPNSRVTLTAFQFDRTRQTGSFVTSVDRGSLGVVSGSIAKSRRDAMRVRTPTSMLGVRGTRFVVEVP
jgi:hypothetical protein